MSFILFLVFALLLMLVNFIVIKNDQKWLAFGSAVLSSALALVITSLYHVWFGLLALVLLLTCSVLILHKRNTQLPPENIGALSATVGSSDQNAGEFQDQETDQHTDGPALPEPEGHEEDLVAGQSKDAHVRDEYQREPVDDRQTKDERDELEALSLREVEEEQSQVEVEGVEHELLTHRGELKQIDDSTDEEASVDEENELLVARMKLLEDVDDIGAEDQEDTAASKHELIDRNVTKDRDEEDKGEQPRQRIATNREQMLKDIDLTDK
ncbi:hypothetical protein [Desertibacillus haloalkaliphilus]|uniref:hypothetical protein n=1 Tax=Desertibacillus haloalkaliphilus TaxID=1328930 RepID=UPI001C257A5A|nr:hypothetical protein [Desertibacillus haloalkaliphilus]MBU8905053.1 hypothetical protein [Desertibacillus haloalkaliphilus]